MIADVPPGLIVPAPDDGHPVRMIGLAATGPQVDLDRLQDTAKKAGFPSQQMDSPDGHELMIVFPPKSDPAVARAFLMSIQNGRFATLTFRSAFAPVR